MNDFNDSLLNCAASNVSFLIFINFTLIILLQLPIISSLLFCMRIRKSLPELGAESNVAAPATMARLQNQSIMI